MKKTLLKQAFAFIFLQLSIACSGVSIGIGGGSGGSNDPMPGGNVLFQGQFSGLNGKSVSGTVMVFSSNSSDYILRLDSLTAPSESGLVVQVVTNPSGAVGNQNLISTSGSKNYTLSGMGSGIIFKTAFIYSTPNNLQYGSAALLP